MRIFMTIIALLEWIALSLQFWLTVNLSISNGMTMLGGVLTFFSFFTILSNLVVALVLTFTLWSPHSRLGGFLSRSTVQTGVAVYIAIVGIIYSVVLRQIWSPHGLQKLADVLLHHLLPLLYVAFWFLFVRKKVCARWIQRDGSFFPVFILVTCRLEGRSLDGIPTVPRCRTGGIHAGDRQRAYFGVSISGLGIVVDRNWPLAGTPRRLSMGEHRAAPPR